MAFMDDQFMLRGQAATDIFSAIQDLPIHDFHCHLDPQEIYEDKPFDNIVQVWLGGDHYKWRLMRANGISEDKITGDAPDKEKFQAWAQTIGKAFGNPLFHFTHLEMKNFFGIEEHLNEHNWEEMYDRLNAVIKERQMSPRQLIKESNVYFIGTTDAPLDTLEWHEKLAEDESFETIVAPTFRPDAAFVQHADFKDFVEQLAVLEEVEIKSFDDFLGGLERRIKHFADHGCKASDISLDGILYEPASKEELDAILSKRMKGEELSLLEVNQWQTELFQALCGLYKDYGFVTQVHFGARRNNNSQYFKLTGPDAGFDSIGDQVNLAAGINDFLNALQVSDRKPKMIWYNLNPAYNTIVSNALANFQANDDGIVNPLQFGSAWWFADNKRGMLDQMETLGEQGILANFVGMLTDSRSFLSYARHDYFRRLVASLLGEWVDHGEIPGDLDYVNQVAKDIAFNNAKNFFE